MSAKFWYLVSLDWDSVCPEQLPFLFTAVLLVAGIDSNKEALKHSVSSSSDGPQTSLRKKKQTNLHVKFWQVKH